MTPKELRELDIWLAINVMRWRPDPEDPLFWTTGGHTVSRFDWNPTTNPADAMQVLKECAIKRTEAWDVYRPDVVLAIFAPHEEWENQWVIQSDPEGTITVRAPTLETAICLFAKQVFSNSTDAH